MKQFRESFERCIDAQSRYAMLSLIFEEITATGFLLYSLELNSIKRNKGDTGIDCIHNSAHISSFQH